MAEAQVHGYAKRMPLVSDMGQLVLKCVNYHGSEYIPKATWPSDTTEKPLTTMEVQPGWMRIPGTTQLHGELVSKTQFRVDMARGVSVRLYVCRDCGYVEMYAAPIGPVSVWPSDG